MSKSGKSKGGPQLGGQFALGGGRVGKTGVHRKPKPNDPRAQGHAQKRAGAARAWAKKSSEFHAKAKAAKTPLERKAYLTAAKKASAKAGEHASAAASFVGKNHKLAKGAQAHAAKAADRDKKRAAHDTAKEQRGHERAKLKEQHGQERAKAKGEREQRGQERAKAKGERDQHRSDVKARKEEWKSGDKTARASKKEDKAWDAKVTKAKAKAEHMDAKERVKKAALEKKKAEFWEKKKNEFQAKAKSAKTPVEKESFLKAASAAEGHSGDSFAWVHALAQIGESVKGVMVQSS